MKGTLRERFEAKVSIEPNSGCWLWTGAYDGKGYGQMRIEGKNKIATHISLQLAGDPRTIDKPCALHKCDNPSCVNPAHLWWGTRKENTADMVSKGRANLSGFSIGHHMNAVMGQRWIVSCAECQTSFQTTPSRARANKRNFCTQHCCHQWQRKHFTGAPRGTINKQESHRANT